MLANVISHMPSMSVRMTIVSLVGSTDWVTRLRLAESQAHYMPQPSAADITYCYCSGYYALSHRGNSGSNPRAV